METDTRLRVGFAIAKTEEAVAQELMQQLKDRGHPETPPPLATDGKGAYREAMVETGGQVPPYSGRGRPPIHKRPHADWHYLQGVKHRAGSQVVQVEIDLLYGDETTLERVGAPTAYVERTNLTSRQMNGRLVRKTLSFSKELEILKAASAWEDAVYNLTHPVKTLREEVLDEPRRYQPRSPAMAAGLTDHLWSIKELLMTVVAPKPSTRDG